MIIIGEKINATIKRTKEIIVNRDEAALADLADAQASAGAGFLDVNVGTGSGTAADEIEAMQWAVSVIQNRVDTPLCIDSADTAVLKAGLEAMDGRERMINSVKAEQDNMSAVIPLAVTYNARLIALPMDEQGIPKTVDDRLRVCDTIVQACSRYDFSLDRILFDPLVLPVSTDITYGAITLDTTAAIKKSWPEAKTVMGLSNVSYGLPKRRQINAGFLYMAVYAGLDAAIADPRDEEIIKAVRVAEALAGKDRHCRRYIKAYRE